MPRKFHFDPTKVFPGDRIYFIRTDSNLSPSPSPTMLSLSRPTLLIAECAVRKVFVTASRTEDVAPLLRTWTFHAVASAPLPGSATDVVFTDKSVAFRTYREASEWLKRLSADTAKGIPGHERRQRIYRKRKKIGDEPAV